MSFLNELTERKVFRVAAGYAIVAWLLVQIVVTVEQPLGLPDWFDTLTIVLLAIGFPVAVVLSWAFDVTPEGVKPAPPSAGTVRSRQGSVILIGEVLILLAVGFLIVDRYLLDHERPYAEGPTGVIRYKYGLDEGEELVPTSGVSVAISADGSRIAYIGQSEGESSQLWIRERDQSEGAPVARSGDARQPFFSPDGSRLGYITENRQVKVLSPNSDDALTLVDGGVSRLGADWADDGYIYFATEAGIVRVGAAAGGSPETVVPLEKEEGVLAYGWPDVDAANNRIVFVILRNHDANDIAVARLDGGGIRYLVEGELARFAATGHLVYAQEDGSLLVAAPDAEAMSLIGESVLMGNWLPVGSTPDFALSDTGRFVYATRPRRTLEAVWVDRSGNWEPVDPRNRLLQMRYAQLSPDDSKLALTSWERPPSDDGQLYVKHLPDGPLSQLSFEGTVNHRPSWHPDGESILFISDRLGNRDVWTVPADGSGPPQLLLDKQIDIDEALASRDGKWLIYRQGMQNGQRDLYFADSSDVTGSAILFVSSEFDEMAPSLSPEGKWLAFVSRRNGETNVYVRPFPASDSETRVSVNGGIEPVWSPAGNELFFRNFEGDMLAVRYEEERRFEVVSTTRLFDSKAYRSDSFHATYDVSEDGQRFVMIRLSDSGSLDEDLHVVENWLDEVNLAVPLH